MDEPFSSPPSAWLLFTSFLRLGLTAFGGPSMIAYIRDMSVERERWLNMETFNDGVALCQVVPGATAMQVAAYVGLKTRGIRGAAISFIGFGLPAFLMMAFYSSLFAYTHNLPVVQAAFSGLQTIIVAIVANATLAFGQTTLKSWQQFIIAGFAAALFGLNINPVLVLFLAAIVGLVLVKPKPSAIKTTPATIDSSFVKPLVAIIIAALTSFLLIFFLDRDLSALAALFFRIDLTAFGGGFASVPLMLHEIVDVRGWMDTSTFMNGIVLGQVTPGPIVITATFIGYLLHGPLGGLVATISIFLPSFLMVIGISPFFDRLRGSLAFNKIIKGILCSFVGLLFTIIFRFAGYVQWDWRALLLALAAFLVLRQKVDVVWVILVGLLVSLLLFSF